MSFGFGFGLPRAPLRGQPLVAVIRSLFANNEPGVWYDPSDFGTIFQDAAGTTPVTAVEQPVGLMLDKSKGLVRGAELVTNGTFDTDLSGWASTASWAWNAGKASSLSPSASGLFPATHYISAGLIEDAFATILPLDIPATEDAEAQRIPGQPEAVLAALPEGYEPVPTLAEVEALFAGIDITASDPLMRMQTLGLAMCQADKPADMGLQQVEPVEL